MNKREQVLTEIHMTDEQWHIYRAVRETVGALLDTRRGEVQIHLESAEIAADAAIRALSGQERKGLVVGEDFGTFNVQCSWQNCSGRCNNPDNRHRVCAEHLCPRLRCKVANQ